MSFRKNQGPPDGQGYMMSPGRKPTHGVDPQELQRVRDNQKLLSIKQSLEESLESLRAVSSAMLESLAKEKKQADISRRLEYAASTDYKDKDIVHTPNAGVRNAAPFVLQEYPPAVASAIGSPGGEHSLYATLTALEAEGLIPTGLDFSWLTSTDLDLEGWDSALGRIRLATLHPRTNTELIDIVGRLTTERLQSAVMGSTVVVGAMLRKEGAAVAAVRRAGALVAEKSEEALDLALRRVVASEGRSRMSLYQHYSDLLSAFGRQMDAEEAVIEVASAGAARSQSQMPFGSNTPSRRATGHASNASFASAITVANLRRVEAANNAAEGDALLPAILRSKSVDTTVSTATTTNNNNNNQSTALPEIERLSRALSTLKDEGNRLMSAEAVVVSSGPEASPHRANNALLVQIITDLEERHVADAETISKLEMTLKSQAKHTAQLQARHDAMLAELEEAARRSEALEEELSSLSSTVRSREAAIEVNVGEVERLSTEKTILEEKISRQESRIKTLAEQLEHVEVEMAAETRAAHERAETAERALEDERNASQALLKENSHRIEELTRLLSEAEAQKEEINENLTITQRQFEAKHSAFVVELEAVSLRAIAAEEALAAAKQQKSEEDDPHARSTSNGHAHNEHMPEAEEGADKKKSEAIDSRHVFRMAADANDLIEADYEAERAYRKLLRALGHPNGTQHAAVSPDAEVSSNAGIEPPRRGTVASCMRLVAHFAAQSNALIENEMEVSTLHTKQDEGLRLLKTQLNEAQQREAEEKSRVAALYTLVESLRSDLRDQLVVCESVAEEKRILMAEKEAIEAATKNRIRENSPVEKDTQVPDSVEKGEGGSRSELSNAALALEAETLRRQLEDAEHEAKRLTKQQDYFKAINDRLTSEAEQAVEKLTVLQAIADKAEETTAQLLEATRSAAHYRGLVDSLQIRLDEATGTVGELHNAADAARIEHGAMSDTIAQLTVDALEAQKQWEAEASLMNGDIAALKEAFVKEQVSAQKSAEALKQAELKLIEQAEESNCRVEQSAKKEAELKAALELAETNFSQLTQDALVASEKASSDINSLTEELRIQKELVDELREALTAEKDLLGITIEGLVSEANAEAQRNDEALKVLRIELEGSQAKNEQLEKRFNAIVEEHKQAFVNVEKEKDSAITLLKSENDASIASHNEVSSQLRDQLEGVTAALKSIESQLVDSEEEREKAKALHEDALEQIRAYEAQLSLFKASAEEERNKDSDRVAELEASLRSVKREHEEAVEEKQRSVVTLTSALEDQQNAFEQKHALCMSLKEELKAAQAAMELNKETVVQKDATIADRDATIKSLEEAHAALRSNAESKAKTLEELTATHRDTLDSLADVRAALEEAQHDAARSAKQLEANKGLLEKLRAQSDADADVIRGLEERLAEMEGVRKKLSVEEAKRRDSEKAFEATEVVQMEVTRLSDRIQRMMVDHEERVTTLNARISLLEHESDTKSAEICELKVALTGSEETVAELNEKLERSNKWLAAANNARQQALEESEALQEELSDKTNMLMSVTNELQRSKEDYDETAMELESSLAETAKCQRMLDGANESVDRLETQAVQYAERLKELEDLLEGAREARNSAEQARSTEDAEERTRYQASVEALKRQLDDMQEEKADLKADLVAEAQRFGTLKAQLDDTVERFADMTERAEASKTKLLEAESVMRVLESERGSLIADVASLEAELAKVKASAQSQIDALSSEVTGLNSEIAENEGSLRAQVDELATLREELSEIREHAEIEQRLLKAKVQAATEDAEAIRQLLAASESAVSALRSSLEEEKAARQQDRDALSQALEDARLRADEELRTLNSELLALHRVIAESEESAVAESRKAKHLAEAQRVQNESDVSALKAQLENSSVVAASQTEAVAALKGQVSTLAEQLAKVDELLSAARDEQLSLGSNLADTQKSLDDALRESADVTKRLTLANDAISELRSALEVSEEAQSKLKMDLADAKMDLSEAEHALEVEKASHSKSVEAAVEEASTLDTKIAALLSQNEDLTAQLDALMSEAISLKEKLIGAEESLAKTHADLHENFAEREAKIVELSHALDEANRTVIKIVDERDALRGEKTALTERAEGLTKCFEDLSHELLMEKETSEALRAELTSKNNEIKTLRDELGSLQADRSAEREAHMEEKAALESNIVTLTDLNRGLDDGFRIERNARLEAEDAAATIKAELKNELATAQSALQNKMEQLDELCAANQALEETVATLRRRLKEAEESLGSVSAALATSEESKGELQKLCNNCQALCEELNHKIELFEGSLKEVSTTNEGLLKAKEVLLEDLTAKTNALNASEAQLAEARRQKDDAETKLGQLRVKSDNQTREIESLNIEKNESKDRVDELERQAQSLQDSLVSFEQVVENIREDFLGRISAKDNKINALKESLQAAEEELAFLTSEKETLVERSQQTRAHMDALENDLSSAFAGAVADLSDRSAALEEARARLVAAEEEKNALIAEKTVLSDALKETEAALEDGRRMLADQEKLFTDYVQDTEARRVEVQDNFLESVAQLENEMAVLMSDSRELMSQRSADEQKLNTAQTRIATLEKEIADLEATQERAVAAAREAKKANAALSSELDDVREEKTSRERQLSAVREAHNDALQSLSAAESKLTLSTVRADGLEDQLRHATKRAADQLGEIDDLSAALRAAAHEKRAAETLCDALRSEADASKKDLDLIKAKFAQSENHLEGLRKEMQQKLTATHDEMHRSETAALERESLLSTALEGAKDCAKTLREEVERLTTELTDFKERTSSEIAQQKDRETEVMRAKAQLEVDIEALRSSCEAQRAVALMRLTESFTREFEMKQAVCGSFVSLLESTSRSVHNLIEKSQLDVVTAMASAHKQFEHDLGTEVEAIKSSEDSKRAQERESHENQVRRLNEAFEALQEEKAALAEELRTLNALCSELKAALSTSKAEEETTATRLTLEAEQLRNTHDAERREWETARAELQAELSSKTEALDAERASIVALNEKMQNVTFEKASLAEDLSKSGEEVAVKTSELFDLNQRHEEIMQRLVKMSDLYEQTKNELAEVMTKRHEQSTDSQIEALNEKLNEASLQIEQKTHVLEERSRIIDDVREQLRQALEQRDEAMEDIRVSSQEVKEIKRFLTEKAHEEASKDAKLEDALKQVEALTVEVGAAQADLADKSQQLKANSDLIEELTVNHAQKSEELKELLREIEAIRSDLTSKEKAIQLLSRTLEDKASQLEDAVNALATQRKQFSEERDSHKETQQKLEDALASIEEKNCELSLAAAQEEELAVSRSALEGRFTPAVEALQQMSEERDQLMTALELARSAAEEASARAAEAESQCNALQERLSTALVREEKETIDRSESSLEEDAEKGEREGERLRMGPLAECASSSTIQDNNETPRTGSLSAAAGDEALPFPETAPPPVPTPQSTAARAETDKRFQNIAWLVATRGTFVVALGDFNKSLYESPSFISVKKTRMRFMELLRDYLSPVEKLHLGLPQEISAIEPITREANQKELVRMLLHSSMAISYPGQEPPQPAFIRHESPVVSPRNVKTRHYPEPIPPLNFSRQVSKTNLLNISGTTTPQALSRNASFSISSPTKAIRVPSHTLTKK